MFEKPAAAGPPLRGGGAGRGRGGLARGGASPGVVAPPFSCPVFVRMLTSGSVCVMERVRHTQRERESETERACCRLCGVEGQGGGSSGKTDFSLIVWQ